MRSVNKNWDIQKIANKVIAKHRSSQQNTLENILKELRLKKK